MNTLTVYLSGPMSGYDDYNYPSFHAAAEVWRDEGYNVISPAENFNGDQGLPKHIYMRKDIEQVMSADIIALLDGWKDSEGSKLEVAVAEGLGLRIVCSCNPRSLHPPDDYPTKMAPLPDVGLPPEAQKDLFNPPDIGTIGTLYVGEREAVAGGSRKAKVLADMLAKGYVTAETKEIFGDTAGPAVAAVMAGLFTRDDVRVFDFSGKADGGGYKVSMDDTSKLPMWLIPTALMRAAARALQHGAKKYAPNNWRRGMPFSEVYSALQRHLTAWIEGEDYDKDSGLNHLDHAAACLGFMAEYAERPEYAKFDDRLKREAA